MLGGARPLPDILPLPGIDNGPRLQKAICDAIEAGKKRFVVGAGDWYVATLVNLGYGFDGFRLIHEDGAFFTTSVNGLYAVGFGDLRSQTVGDNPELQARPDYVRVQDVAEGATQAVVAEVGGAGVEPGDNYILTDTTSTWGGTVYTPNGRNAEWVAIESVVGDVVTFAPYRSLYGPQDDHPMNPVPRGAAGRDYSNAQESELKVDGLTGGTFTFTLDGQTTPELPYDASASAFQAAVRAIVPTAVVTQGYPVWRISFPDGLAHTFGFGFANATGSPVFSNSKVRRPNSARIVRIPPAWITKNVSFEGIQADLYAPGAKFGQCIVYAALCHNVSVWRADAIRFQNACIGLTMCKDATVYDSTMDGCHDNGAGSGYGIDVTRSRHVLLENVRDTTRTPPPNSQPIRHGVITHSALDLVVKDSVSGTAFDTHGLDDRRIRLLNTTGSYNIGNSSFLDGGKDYYIDQANGGPLKINGDLRNLRVDRLNLHVTGNASPIAVASGPDQYPKNVTLGSVDGPRGVSECRNSHFVANTEGDTTKAPDYRVGNFLVQNTEFRAQSPAFIFKVRGEFTLKDYKIVATASHFDGSTYSNHDVSGLRPIFMVWTSGLTLSLQDGTANCWTGSGFKENCVLVVTGPNGGNPGAAVQNAIHLQNLSISGIQNFGGFLNDSSPLTTLTYSNVTANGAPLP